MKGSVLIVDDKVRLCKSLAWNFEHVGFQPRVALNADAALALLKTEPVDVALVDIMLGEENGVDLLERMLAIRPDLPVIMITAYASIDSAVRSIKLGAFDYVRKPLDFDELLKTVQNAYDASRLKEENVHLRTRIAQMSGKIVTQNEKMLELYRKIQRLATTDLPVLLCGESGTGKELLADYIHSSSHRCAREMLKVNCAAFADTLLDNELFGHEKGAYTGATSRFTGVFEKASGSTLFLDEIGDMPRSIQAKILRALQNNEIRRLGGEETIRIDVRFIAATNKEVRDLIDEGSFRQDLYYRLSTAVLTIPPLRERKDDIPMLVQHFIDESQRTVGGGTYEVSPAVMARLQAYAWPGNVRELKNTIHYAAAMSASGKIDLKDLPVSFFESAAPASSFGMRQDLERDLILRTLQDTKYNRSKTAVILNMTRKTLYNKMRKYGIGT